MTTAADRDKAIAKLQKDLAAEIKQRIASDAGVMNVVTGAFNDADATLNDGLKADIRAAIADHEKRLHAPAPPVISIPPIPAKTAAMTLHHDFAKDGLGPFVAQDYPNGHEADKDPMLGWNPDKTKPRYLNQKFYTGEGYLPAYVSVHNGYLDLLAHRDPAGYFYASLVATFAKNDATKRTFEMGYGTVRVMARIVGAGAAAWQTPLWLWDAWRAPEIDWPEVIGGWLTANVHGSSADGQKASTALEEGWHEYRIARTATATEFYIDNDRVGQAGPGLPQRMALLIDAKYGLAAPDATTPAELRTQVAWLVVTE